jgi:hypothetical protein
MLQCVISKKPLIKTNPYPKRRKAMLRRSVLSSTAVEDVRLAADDLRLCKRSTKKAPVRPFPCPNQTCHGDRLFSKPCLNVGTVEHRVAEAFQPGEGGFFDSGFSECTQRTTYFRVSNPCRIILAMSFRRS